MSISPVSKEWLDQIVERVNRPQFIEDDPILIPHRFTLKQDIEIAGLWTAILAWGLRKTIIHKADQLMNWMDYAPFDFIKNHQPSDRIRFSTFKHRTFNGVDAMYFLEALQGIYLSFESLEDVFLVADKRDRLPIETGLNQFRSLFFSFTKSPIRTEKHVASPLKKSTCKRLNMFLRWMVRRDEAGVDFGIWKRLNPADLMIPLDVHVEKISRRLGLLKRPQRDWEAVKELTETLKRYDPKDPVKYDFALFGLGVNADQIDILQDSKIGSNG